MATTKSDSFVRTGKRFCGNENSSGREKRKHLREKFQQVAMEALLKKGEDDRMFEDERERAVEIPNQIEVSLNLSKMNLNEFPNELLDKMEDVQYLYLEGTKLTELPDTFFEKLPSLKWLDLRNNALTSLPTAGLKNHSGLEVILLQGNKIRNLPIELATIPSLKGLQTIGNPLTNVPYDCIAEGFTGIMNHLKKLYLQNDILVPSSEMIMLKPSTSQDETLDKSALNGNELADSEFRSWNMDNLTQWQRFMRKKSYNSNGKLKNHTSKNEKPSLQKPRATVKVRYHPRIASFKPVPFRCGNYHRNKCRTTFSALHYLKMRKTKLGYKTKPITPAMVEEKARREEHLTLMRETLEKQARKIQRLRDKDVLKSWRDHAKFTKNQIKLMDNYQQYPSKDFADRTPFDVDPEFLNMLNRVDLYRSLRDYDNKSRRIKKPKIRITASDLERQMNEIVNKLRNLDTGEGEDDPMASNQFQVCNKMSKIWDIQKTLKKLQAINSSIAGLTPFKIPESKK